MLNTKVGTVWYSGTDAIFTALRIFLFLVQPGALFEVTNNHMHTTMQYHGLTV
jgi:hypothetical protein